MTRYEFPSMVAKDPTQDVTVKSGSGFVYAPGDITFSTPLATFDRYGAPKNAIGCTSEGLTEEFYVDDQPVVWWKSAGYAFLISSFTGMLAATRLAEAAAEDAAGSARAAAAAAQTALSGMASATDNGVAGLINDTTTATRTALNAVFAAGGMAAKTVDTSESFKAVLFADGTVAAVPSWATAPALPTNLIAVAGPTAVHLTWSGAAGAARYAIYRDGHLADTTTALTYRDTGNAGDTHTYTVASVNNYGMHSLPPLPSVTVFLDPALNTPTQLHVTTWPTVVAATGRSLVRVNAWDYDGQLTTPTLTCSSGTLQPTFDPSVWVYSP